MTRRFEVAAHLGALRRYALVLAGDGSDADDLVQGALLRAVERVDQWREDGNLRVWLMSILHNHFIDQTRARHAARTRDDAWADLAPSVALPQGDDAVRLAQVRAALLGLPEDQREALHLVALEGLSVAEAAAVLGIPPGTVMSRVGRARAALRRFEEGGALKPRLRIVGEDRDP